MKESSEISTVRHQKSTRSKGNFQSVVNIRTRKETESHQNDTKWIHTKININKTNTMYRIERRHRTTENNQILFRIGNREVFNTD